jgi:hypothetical protein
MADALLLQADKSLLNLIIFFYVRLHVYIPGRILVVYTVYMRIRCLYPFLPGFLTADNKA